MAALRTDFYLLVHKGQRHVLFELSRRAGQLDWRDDGARVDLVHDIDALIAALLDHADKEDEFLQPLIRESAPEIAKRLENEHSAVEVKVAALQNATAIALLEKAPEYDLAVYRALARFVAAYLPHLDLEEVGAMPALLENFDEVTLSAVQRRILAATAPSILRYNLQAMLPAIPALEGAALIAALCARLGPAEIAELRASLGGLAPALDWPEPEAVTAA